jgi:hypothetical protein
VEVAVGVAVSKLYRPLSLDAMYLVTNVVDYGLLLVSVLLFVKVGTRSHVVVVVLFVVSDFSHHAVALSAPTGHHEPRRNPTVRISSLHLSGFSDLSRLRRPAELRQAHMGLFWLRSPKLLFALTQLVVLHMSASLAVLVVLETGAGLSPWTWLSLVSVPDTAQRRHSAGTMWCMWCCPSCWQSRCSSLVSCTVHPVLSLSFTRSLT